MFFFHEENPVVKIIFCLNMFVISVVRTNKDRDVVILEIFNPGEVIIIVFRGFNRGKFGGIEIIDADSMRMNETRKGDDFNNHIESWFTVETK